MEVSTENPEIGIVQMLFADVNATQYQLQILEKDVTGLIATYNICLVPGEYISLAIIIIYSKILIK